MEWCIFDLCLDSKEAHGAMARLRQLSLCMTIWVAFASIFTTTAAVLSRLTAASANELSYVILESVRPLQTSHPDLCVRIHTNPPNHRRALSRCS
jgi:hypothetical protein